MLQFKISMRWDQPPNDVTLSPMLIYFDINSSTPHHYKGVGVDAFVKCNRSSLYIIDVIVNFFSPSVPVLYHVCTVLHHM